MDEDVILSEELKRALRIKKIMKILIVVEMIVVAILIFAPEI